VAHFLLAHSVVENNSLNSLLVSVIWTLLRFLALFFGLVYSVCGTGLLDVKFSLVTLCG